MVRSWLPVLMCALLIVVSGNVASALPEAEEDIYWFHFEDETGDETDRCTLLNDGGQPTPCDIHAFSIGNTDTHLFVRWTMATLDFGTTGELGFVDFSNSFRGTHGEDNRADVDFRLLSSGELEVDPYDSDNVRDDWVAEMEWGELSDNQITYAVPLNLVGNLMADGRGEPWNFVNVSSPSTSVNPIGQLDESVIAGHSLLNTNGDSLVVPEEGRSYIIQPYGSLMAPPEGPDLFFENVTGDLVEVDLAFDEPTNAVYTYNWSTELEAVLLQFAAEPENGTVGLDVVDPANETLVSESFTVDNETDLDELNATVGRQLAPVAAGNWTLTLSLEDYVGSLQVTARAAPEPGDDDYDPDVQTTGGANNDGNQTGPADVEEGGIPAAGAVLVLAVLMGFISLRRGSGSRR